MKKFIKGIYDRTQVKKYSNITDRILTESDKPRIIMFLVPSYGNLGDHAIAEGQKLYINDNFPNHEYIEITFLNYKYSKKKIMKNINDNDLLLINGGGFIGTLWKSAHLEAQDIVNSFPNNPIIQFPQTIHFDNSEEGKKLLIEFDKTLEDAQNFKFFLREKKSYDFMQQNFKHIDSELVPDTAMYLEKTINAQRNGVLFCIRDDKEKINNDNIIDALKNILSDENINYEFTDTVISKKLTPKDRSFYLNSKLKEFSESKLVVTDRLHGMIFALITGTPCIALDNSSKKVSGVYEWIQDIENIVLMKSDDINNNLSQSELKQTTLELLDIGGLTYNNTTAEERLVPLKSAMSEKLMDV